jgi:hypothetical protein
MLTKLKAFFRLSLRRKYLFFLTVLLSFYTHILMRFFNKKARFGDKRIRPGGIDNSLIRDICWGIFAADKWVPWKNACRHQAYQAKILCRLYKQPCQIFVGFKKNSETGSMEGHSWTVVDEKIITGFCNPEEYTILNVYQ